MLDKIIDECERWGVVVAIESNDWEGEVLDYLKEYRNYRKKIAHLSDACVECPGVDGTATSIRVVRSQSWTE